VFAPAKMIASSIYFELESDYLKLEYQSSKVEIQPQELQNEDDN
jgi:hypothetical protein